MLTQREKMNVVIIEGLDRIARVVAERIASVIRSKATEGAQAVLGLATGSTPLGVYRELIRMHREEGLDFSNVVTFNLDEYFPMDPGSMHSYHRYMWENLFDHVNIRRENVHIPRGDIPKHEVDEHCRAFEEAIVQAGGLDFQLLGIGRTGHIGFNEPGSGPGSRTRLIFLDTLTRRDAAGDFFGEDNVPVEAITMGVGTILEAREIVLMATGEHKAKIVQRAVEGPVDPDVPATYLQGQPNVTVYLDPPAAAELTRIKTPWLVGEVEWTREREVEAVAWLSEQVGKSILRLGERDYRDQHLSSLVARYGSAPRLNGEVFNALIAKIRGKSKLPREKRIVLFSPHPDDDVICTGATLHKLQGNDNQIVIAYQTSGNIGVVDDELRRYSELMRRVGRAFQIRDSALDELPEKIERFLADKAPDQVDIPEVQELKRAIREAEAVAALETLRLQPSQARFLNLPFYRTGEAKKNPIGERDVEIVVELLEEMRPEIVFVAGDQADPHGTHRKCKEAIDRALARYSGPSPEVWLYRGAWEEWPVDEASVFVPMSEEELRLKILAVFKHESQRDKVPYASPGDRDIWQRVEERNRGTAATLERLGLPAYFAMEAFVVERDGQRLENPAVPTSSLGAEAHERSTKAARPAKSKT
ncbi:MAG: glucosamine-6-phosphate deaminase [Gemmatimonadota bacterium]|nr:MAG: glucosamine-6-phosphate deaminase [Gemmatimonadota bacterium]